MSMESIDCSFAVNYRYLVHFTRNVFDLANPLLRTFAAEHQIRKILIALEESLVSSNAHLPAMAEVYFRDAGVPHSVHVLPGGENAKEDHAAVREFYRILLSENLCRHSCVAAMGGGAFLDVAGFAAATLHRGIGHLRFPSTLLGQADAGVGVKNGINFSGKKNSVGTFAPPLAVINDLELLNTLPPSELRAGLSEAVKVGLIKDAEFFEWIEKSAAFLREGRPQEIERLARRCAALHVEHIGTGGDPFERGSRRPLDFGHWAAHKLEQMSGFRLRHGEAVAIGIALDSVYASLVGDLPRADLERILTLLRCLGLPAFTRELQNTQELLTGLQEFREHLGGELCVTLLRGIGTAHEVNCMDPDLVIAAIHELAQREQ